MNYLLFTYLAKRNILHRKIVNLIYHNINSHDVNQKERKIKPDSFGKELILPLQCFYVYFSFYKITVQAILLAFEAILGHKSAHSFATGPVIAEPFISPLLLTITPALSSK